jgi:hypothetical protein
VTPPGRLPGELDPAPAPAIVSPSVWQGAFATHERGYRPGVGLYKEDLRCPRMV